MNLCDGVAICWVVASLFSSFAFWRGPLDKQCNLLSLRDVALSSLHTSLACFVVNFIQMSGVLHRTLHTRTLCNSLLLCSWQRLHCVMSFLLFFIVCPLASGMLNKATLPV